MSETPEAKDRAADRDIDDSTGTANGPSIAARFIGRLIAWLLRVQCATWRIEAEGIEAFDAAWDRGDRVLLVFWHGKYIPLFPLLAGRQGCVFSSVSFRGDVIAEICRYFGFDVVQIRDNGGRQSLRLMRRALSESRRGAIAVDGPLGPRYRVHEGAIRLASELRFALVPASVTAKRKFVRGKRWDKMEIPVPMTRLYAEFGEPIHVPAALGEDQLTELKARIGAALAELDRKTAHKIEGPRSSK